MFRACLILHRSLASNVFSKIPFTSARRVNNRVAKSILSTDTDSNTGEGWDRSLSWNREFLLPNTGGKSPLPWKSPLPLEDSMPNIQKLNDGLAVVVGDAVLVGRCFVTQMG
jgi:hypothetical protein